MLAMQITQAFPVAVKPEMVEGKPFIKIIPMQSILEGGVVDHVDLDQFPEGISAIFDKDGFTLWQTLDYTAEYMYHVNYPYKEMGVLLAWLKQQNMLMPEAFNKE